MSKNVDIKELLSAGVHFGHKTSRWHPKMAPYIHSAKGGGHIINLEKTVEALEKALPALTERAAAGPVLFVGTKKSLRELTKAAAEKASMPYVVNRWIGGMLTNKKTISAQISKLADLEKKMEAGELSARYSKLEVKRFQDEIDLLDHRYGGIKDLTTNPTAMVITDAIVDKNALAEAKTLGIPVFAIADTNVDPTLIDYPVPANDDALKAVELILDYFVNAIKGGKK